MRKSNKWHGWWLQTIGTDASKHPVRESVHEHLSNVKKRFAPHWRDFKLIWIAIFLMVGAAVLFLFSGYENWSWSVLRIVGYLAIAFIAFLFITRPMNAVYGLMGTSGSVRLFFTNYLLITLLFSCIYQFGFFYEAAVSYDVNQPHIDYGYYHNISRERKEQPDTTSLTIIRVVDGQRMEEKIEQVSTLVYQPISFWQTWRNTVLTSLMQEPTDFFAAAATYNAGMEKVDRVHAANKSRIALFHWILIIQILISWIFFGVFISLLYNKFRYES